MHVTSPTSARRLWGKTFLKNSLPLGDGDTVIEMIKKDQSFLKETQLHVILNDELDMHQYSG